jgi:hypothetical protein
MNQNEITELSNRELPLYTLLSNLIREPNFINLGVIKKVHNENYVDVATYYLNNVSEETIITDVRVLHEGTTKLKVFVQPAIGDNVLLITPKDNVEELVYNHKAADQEYGFAPYGNTNACCILIKDESDDNVLTSININEDGDVDFSTQGLISASQIDDQGEEKASVKVDADGNIAIKSEKNIHLNGGESESHLVRYEELQQGLNALWTAIQTHTHPYTDDGTPATTGASLGLADKTLDISKAKIDTILTKQASAT